MEQNNSFQKKLLSAFLFVGTLYISKFSRSNHINSVFEQFSASNVAFFVERGPNFYSDVPVLSPRESIHNVLSNSATETISKEVKIPPFASTYMHIGNLIKQLKSSKQKTRAQSSSSVILGIGPKASPQSHKNSVAGSSSRNVGTDDSMYSQRVSVKTTAAADVAGSVLPVPESASEIIAAQAFSGGRALVEPYRTAQTLPFIGLLHDRVSGISNNAMLGIKNPLTALASNSIDDLVSGLILSFPPSEAHELLIKALEKALLYKNSRVIFRNNLMRIQNLNNRANYLKQQIQNGLSDNKTAKQLEKIETRRKTIIAEFNRPKDVDGSLDNLEIKRKQLKEATSRAIAAKIRNATPQEIVKNRRLKATQPELNFTREELTNALLELRDLANENPLLYYPENFNYDNLSIKKVISIMDARPYDRCDYKNKKVKARIRVKQIIFKAEGGCDANARELFSSICDNDKSIVRRILNTLHNIGMRCSPDKTNAQLLKMIKTTITDPDFFTNVVSWSGELPVSGTNIRLKRACFIALSASNQWRESEGIMVDCDMPVGGNDSMMELAAECNVDLNSPPYSLIYSDQASSAEIHHYDQNSEFGLGSYENGWAFSKDGPHGMAHFVDQVERVIEGKGPLDHNLKVCRDHMRRYYAYQHSPRPLDLYL